MPPPTLLLFRRTAPIQVFEQAPTFALTQDGGDVETLGGRDASTNTTAANGSRNSNAVCEAFGKRFCVYGNAGTITIRERNEGGSGNWGTVYTFASGAVNNFHSGLAVCHADGQEILGSFYLANNGGVGDIITVWTTDGVNWNESLIFDPGSGGLNQTGKVFGWRSTLYWTVKWNSTTYTFFTYDFATNTAGTVASTGTSNYGALSSYSTIHKNNLFIVTWSSGSPASWTVRRLDGTSWTTVYTSTEQMDGGWPQEHMGPCLFTDPGTGDLILIAQVNDVSEGGKGYIVRQISNADTNSGLTDASGDITERSSTVLPASFQIGSLTPDGGHMWEAFVDNVTDPADTTVYLLRTVRGGIINDSPQDDGTGHVWYEWNGVGSMITQVGTPSTTGADWAICSVTEGGGEYVKTSPAARPTWDGGILLNHGAVTSGPFVAGETLTGTSGTAIVRTVYSTSLDVDIVSGTFSNTDSISGGTSGASATLTTDSVDLATPTEVAGGTTKVYFRINGSGVAINVQVRLSTNEDAVTTVMTLVAGTVTVEAGSPATTPTNTTSQISNLTPDSGSAIYSIQLNTTADGIAAGEGYSITMVPV